MKKVAYYTDHQKSLFCKRLKFLRKEYNFSQTIIAKKLGISLRAYQTYEKGECMPRVDTIISLCNIYNIPLILLLYGNTAFERENLDEMFLAYLFLLLSNKRIIAERNTSKIENEFKFLLFPIDHNIENFLIEFDKYYQGLKDSDLSKLDIYDFSEIMKKIKTNRFAAKERYKELFK